METDRLTPEVPDDCRGSGEGRIGLRRSEMSTLNSYRLPQSQEPEPEKVGDSPGRFELEDIEYVVARFESSGRLDLRRLLR